MSRTRRKARARNEARAGRARGSRRRKSLVSLASRSVPRPVAVAMLFIAVAVVGVVSALRLPVDLLPDIAYPRLVVYTTWQSVGPLEVQRLVSEPIERATSRVAGVERVESVSREGVSLVTLRFAWGTDMDFAALSVREQLDNLRDALPELADRPAVLRTDPTRRAHPLPRRHRSRDCGRCATWPKPSSSAASSRSTASRRRSSPAGSSARSRWTWTRARWRRTGWASRTSPMRSRRRTSACRAVRFGAAATATRCARSVSWKASSRSATSRSSRRARARARRAARRA